MIDAQRLFCHARNMFIELVFQYRKINVRTVTTNIILLGITCK